MTWVPDESKFKPAYVQGTLYYGLELELDRGEYGGCVMWPTHDHARGGIRDVMGDQQMFTGDGSLDDGIEVRFYPMTYEHFIKQPWEAVCRVARETGYKNEVGRAGIHIHTSIEGMGKDTHEQHRTIVGCCLLYNKFWKQLMHLSRREFDGATYPNPCVHRCAEGEKAITDSAMMMSGQGRNAVSYIPGDPTIEFRMFKGSTDANTIIANVQTVKAIIELSMKYGTGVQRMEWAQFVKHCNRYAQLSAHIKERGLRPLNLKDCQPFRGAPIVRKYVDTTAEVSANAFLQRRVWVRYTSNDSSINGYCPPASSNRRRWANTPLPAFDDVEAPAY